MDALKELLTPKTVNKISFVANSIWIVFGVILSGIFLDVDINESRFDFHCGGSSDKELIRGKCYEQYEKKYNKFGIPVYGFVIFNFLVTSMVVGIYSEYIKSRVEELETRNVEVERPAQQGNPTQRQLFKAYCCQLATRFALGILFIILQTEVIYDSNFPSDFQCNITTVNHTSGNITRTQTYECHNRRATKKTFWTNVVIVVTGFFAFLVFIEVLWILSRARKGKQFMEDSQFFADYLKSKSYPRALIQTMKDNVIKNTEVLSDFPSWPFRPDDDEDDKLPKNVKLDHIYTNLRIHRGRVKYDFTGDREQQLNEYPKPNANLPPTQPKDIIDAEHKKILVVGRPGIGKTIFCTKFLRDWASNSVFNEAQNSLLHFKAAFLIKFRRFKSAVDLSLRDLLAQSEFSTPLNNELWKYILKNPTKVLLIFDGIDEFNAKEKIAEDDSYLSNTDKMPLHALYKKVVAGTLLDGATVLTTTRPTALSFVRPLSFDRTVEILGFTSQQVQDYVNKFTKNEQKVVGETIWRHISSNLNIFTLCYIPVNCFIICMCLLQTLKDSPYSLASRLPKKLTEIYSIAIKIIVFKHSDKYRFSKEEDRQNFIRKPFNELPKHLKQDFKRLGKIAFQGIKEGRLIFESHEVKNLVKCGLLHRLRNLRQHPFKEARAQYCFLHLTIQEFLAAKYVTDTMKDPKQRTEFIKGHIKKGEWKMVMQFVAGLLGSISSDTRIFTDLLPKSTLKKTDFQLTRMFSRNAFEVFKFDSEPRRLTCWPVEQTDKELALTLCKCFHEIDVKDSTVQNKLNKIGFSVVDFQDCRVGPVDCSAVVNLLKNYELLALDLSVNRIGLLGCMEIVKLLCRSNSKLSSLNLSHNHLTDEALKPLVKALTNINCKLSKLDLDFNHNITDEALKDLFKALPSSNCKLSSLDLRQYNVKNIKFEVLKPLYKALTHSDCKLSNLNLSGNFIAPTGLNDLFKVLMHSNCKLGRLTWGSAKITIEFEALNPLFKPPTDSDCKQCTLNLVSVGNQVPFKYLFEALTHSDCKLGNLDLLCQMTVENVKILAKALVHPKCKFNSLYFSCKITHEQVKILVGALTDINCKLNSLKISEKAITHKEDLKLLTEACRHVHIKLRFATV